MRSIKMRFASTLNLFLGLFATTSQLLRRVFMGSHLPGCGPSPLFLAPVRVIATRNGRFLASQAAGPRRQRR
jgi:hypothetical protein